MFPYRPEHKERPGKVLNGVVNMGYLEGPGGEGAGALL